MTWMPSHSYWRNWVTEGMMRDGKASVSESAAGANFRYPVRSQKFHAVPDTPMKSPSRAFRPAVAFAAVALAGCAGTYGPQKLPAGASVNEVLAQLGTPTARYPR